MILVPLDDPELEATLAGLSPDGMTIFALGGGRVRGALLHGSRLVNAMRANHALGPLETLVLGRAYLCAGLLSSGLKGGDSIGIRVDGDGPAEGLSVEVKADGSVRGYLFRNPITLQAPPESLDTAPLFGKGALTVTRFSAVRPRPYSGTISLRTGRFAEDLAAYYLESEQTRTAFDAGIQFDRAGHATGAGALFLQAMPGAEDSFLERVEATIPGLPPLGLWFGNGGTRDRFIDGLFAALDPQRLGEKQVQFRCGCSRERFGSFLASANRELLADIVENGPWPAETECHNCGSTYSFTKDELEGMLRGE